MCICRRGMQKQMEYSKLNGTTLSKYILWDKDEEEDDTFSLDILDGAMSFEKREMKYNICLIELVKPTLMTILIFYFI